jgi:hypothetical protein
VLGWVFRATFWTVLVLQNILHFSFSFLPKEFPLGWAFNVLGHFASLLKCTYVANVPNFIFSFLLEEFSLGWAFYVLGHFAFF